LSIEALAPPHLNLVVGQRLDWQGMTDDALRTASASSAPTSRWDAASSSWSFLDLTPLGSQEEWQDTPPGRPQTRPYDWWRLHDQYARA
jgi:predicted dithiol-disulfide oxidoreductase (DUF899 family)